MKPRLLLMFALLTLMGLSLAGAAMAEPALSQAAPAVDASPSTASFLCSLNQSVATPEGVAGLNPVPVLKAGTCGPCSLSPCVGATNGVTACSLGTRLGRCQDVYGDICTGGTLKCQCWSGPLP
jgi:hypothetical protein